MSEIIIFTDGASKGNPGPGGWGAIIANTGKVKELGGGEAHTTNNRMELLATIHALDSIVHENASIVLNTDSYYVINGITKWVKGWQKNNWKTKEKGDVLNKDLWQKLAELANGKKIIWNHVGGHVGIPGNDRCDEIATSFAGEKNIQLFDGDQKKYDIDLTINEGLVENTEKRSASKARSTAKAYSYLSMVDGKIQMHTTWAECEARVKGVKGAKFKKSLNKEEEQEIIKSWTK